LSAESFAAAMRSLMSQYPDLAEAYNRGFIAADNWALLATLLPNVAGEIKKIHGIDGYNLRSGNYSSSARTHVYKDNDGREVRCYVR
jgi:hypothetical protein